MPMTVEETGKEKEVEPEKIIIREDSCCPTKTRTQIDELTSLLPREYYLIPSNYSINFLI